jgi:hypothetical protein
MKLQIGLLAFMSATGIALAQYQEIDLQFEQTGNSLSANWAGTPLTVTPAGADTWDVSLSSGGYEIDALYNSPISWDTPAGGTGYEVVSYVNSTTVEYQSDVASPAGAGPYGLGVSFLYGVDNGTGQAAYAQVFDKASAPDAGSSASLLGLALAGLGVVRSWLSTKRQ